MATSIVFGLAYGTLLILVVVPAMLSLVEEYKPRRFKQDNAHALDEGHPHEAQYPHGTRQPGSG